MKGILLVSYSLLLIPILVGCNLDSSQTGGESVKNTPSTTLESNGEISDASSLDLEDLEYIKEKYLDNVVLSHITDMTWGNAAEIDPDSFVVFYSYLSMQKSGEITMGNSNELSEDNGTTLLSADALERVVKQYFDVTIENIRKSAYYRADTNTYEIWGIGGATDCKLLDARQVDNLLVLSFEAYQDAELFSKGELAVAIVSDDSYSYVSCNVESIS